MCICTTHIFRYIYIYFTYYTLYYNIKAISAAQLSYYKEGNMIVSLLTISMIFHLTVRMRVYARIGSPHCSRHSGTSIFPSFLPPLSHHLSFFFSPSLSPFLLWHILFVGITISYYVQFAFRLFSLGARRKPRTVVAKGKSYANTLTNNCLTS